MKTTKLPLKLLPHSDALRIQWPQQYIQDGLGLVRFNVPLDTHNRWFRRRIFPGNQLHWYW